MKKFVSLCLSLLMIVGLLAVMPTTNVQAAAANSTVQMAEEIQVNEVPDVLVDQDINYCGIPAIERDIKGSQFFYYKFVLNKPAYVKISSYAKIFEYNFNGDLYVYLSSGMIFNKKIISTWAEGSQDSTAKFYAYLNAGTYYLKVELEANDDKDSYWNYNPECYVSVNAEYTDASTKGVSKNDAIQMKNGIKSEGVVGYFKHNNYFTFDVKEKSNVTIYCNTVAKGDWQSVKSSNNACMHWKVYKDDKCIASMDTLYDCWNDSKEYTKNGDYTFNLSNLSKGKYYIEVASNAPYDYTSGNPYGNATASCTINIMSAPAIKNLAVDKSKKKITATITNQGKVIDGYEYKVSTDKKLKGAKVKKTSNKSNVVFNCKKGKTYYVSVRSYWVDVNENVHYSNWSKIKSVKVTK